MHQLRLQFRLSQLLLAVTGVAVAIGIVLNFQAAGVLIAFFVCFTVFCVRAPGSRRWSVTVWVCCMLVMIVLLIPTVRPGYRPGAICRSHLNQLALAIDMYKEQHHRYPPPYTIDNNGQKLHGWRTLILPYLERKALYDQIKLDEPWDSPHNSQFHSEVAFVFRCPLCVGTKEPKTMTSYVAVVGPYTAWPATGDGLSSLQAPETTVLLVEIAHSGIHWMEPRDLHTSQMSPRVNPPWGQGISSRHPGVAIVVFANGNTRALLSTTEAKDIAKLLSRHANDKSGLGENFD